MLPMSFLAFVEGAELIIFTTRHSISAFNAGIETHWSPGNEGVLPVGDRYAGDGQRRISGKRNSLDALCDRFDIDRSNRTLRRP